MIFWFIFIVLLAAVVYITLKYYLLPKRRFEYYSKHLKDLGYKVYEFPFAPFRAPYFDKYYTCFNQYGDSVYMEKNVFSNYDIVLSNVLDTVCLTIQNLQLVKRFYQPDSVFNFYKHPTFSEGIKLSFGQGIFFSEKDAWKRKRKIISKVFNYDLIIKNVPIISQIADETMDQLQIQSNLFEEQNDDLVYLEPRNLGFRVFSRVMMRCFFQTEFKDSKINNVKSHTFLESLFEELNNLAGGLLVILLGSLTYKLGVTQSHRKFNQKIGVLQREISQLIDQKVAKFKQKNLKKQNDIKQQKTLQNTNCDMIEKLFEEKLKGEESYDKTELIEEFCTFLLAGTDTTTNFLRSMIYFISKNPSIQEKLRKQIQLFIQSEEDIENIEILKKLTYLECIQNEVIRMASPSASCFIRINEKEMMFQTIKLKKGTGMFIEPFANHFNEKYFPNPHQFRPQRWMQNKNTLVPYAFTGFFGGPRTCIGKHLAYLESKIVLIKLLRRYKSMEISGGGERMEVRFLYGPEKFYVRMSKND